MMIPPHLPGRRRGRPNMRITRADRGPGRGSRALAIWLSRDRWDPVSPEWCLHSRSRLPVLRDHRAEVQHPEDKSSILHVLQDQQLCRERDLSVRTASSNSRPSLRACRVGVIPVDFLTFFDWDRADIMPADLEIVAKRRTLTKPVARYAWIRFLRSSCHNRPLANNVANALANMPVARDAEFLSQNLLV